MLNQQKIGINCRTPTSKPKRSDSPRPNTPLNHFRTDLPTINDGTEIEYFTEAELEKLEDIMEHCQKMRIDMRRPRFASEIAT